MDLIIYDDDFILNNLILVAQDYESIANIIFYIYGNDIKYIRDSFYYFVESKTLWKSIDKNMFISKIINVIYKKLVYARECLNKYVLNCQYVDFIFNFDRLIGSLKLKETHENILNKLITYFSVDIIFDNKHTLAFNDGVYDFVNKIFRNKHRMDFLTVNIDSNFNNTKSEHYQSLYDSLKKIFGSRLLILFSYIKKSITDNEKQPLIICNESEKLLFTLTFLIKKTFGPYCVIIENTEEKIKKYHRLILITGNRAPIGIKNKGIIIFTTNNKCILQEYTFIMTKKTEDNTLGIMKPEWINDFLIMIFGF